MTLTTRDARSRKCHNVAMSSFEISRSTVIAVDPARLYDLVADFHQWPSWSPWEGVDPDLQRSYGGPDQGVGATYAWKGNRRAGMGSMAITGATPEQIDITLSFEKPFRATNETSFSLDPTPTGGTEVTWTMRGERSGVMGMLSKVVPFDRLIAKDFDKGLAQLDATARA